MKLKISFSVLMIVSMLSAGAQSTSNIQFVLEKIKEVVKKIEIEDYEIYKIQLGEYSEIETNIDENDLKSFPYNDTIFLKAISIVDRKVGYYHNSNFTITKSVRNYKTRITSKPDTISNQTLFETKKEKNNMIVDIWSDYFVVKKNVNYEPYISITNYLFKLDLTPRLVSAVTEYSRNNSKAKSNLKTLILILYNRRK